MTGVAGEGSPAFVQAHVPAGGAPDRSPATLVASEAVTAAAAGTRYGLGQVVFTVIDPCEEALKDAAWT
jgi:hypothetical protein